MRSSDTSIAHILSKGHIATLIVAICLLASCAMDTVYYHFQQIAEEGWDKRDTLLFRIDTLLQEGDYDATLCLRTDAAYPYRNLSVKTVLTVRPRNASDARRMDFCIVNPDGTANGDGITFRSHEKDICTIHLAPGDSLTVKVAHNMRKETMPGVRDVGIKITRKQ